MVSGHNSEDLKSFLDFKSQQYNSFDFIKDDPIQIPHLFDKKEDIEISAFLTSIISWGNRKSIIKSAKKMMELLDFSPHEFIINSTKNEIKKLNFVHRTFNTTDFQFFPTCFGHFLGEISGSIFWEAVSKILPEPQGPV